MADFLRAVQVREVRAMSPFDTYPARSLYCVDRRLSLQYLGETVLVCDLPSNLTDLSLAEL
eukprot:2374450-Lingulodinium_polyedra.AAC.1